VRFRDKCYLPRREAHGKSAREFYDLFIFYKCLFYFTFSHELDDPEAASFSFPLERNVSTV